MMSDQELQSKFLASSMADEALWARLPTYAPPSDIEAPPLFQPDSRKGSNGDTLCAKICGGLNEGEPRNEV